MSQQTQLNAETGMISVLCHKQFKRKDAGILQDLQFPELVFDWGIAAPVPEITKAVAPGIQ
jgi:hypothetical protein